MRKAFHLCCNQPWAITQDALRQILAIANRENLPIEAVETQLGRKLDNTRMVTERGGVAIIPVAGPIVRYANLFSEISGATSIELLARDFTTALHDPNVRAILLNIDSPGGDINGVNEFANMVYAARGVKPITAYVGGLGCSAAYWIASACDSIVADETALLGSIGVIAAIPDPNIAHADEVIFVASQSPRKHADPTTKAGASDIQAVLDATAQIFVETVARNRATTAERVLTDFGQGGVFVGAGALSAGLIDRLGAFEKTLAGMTGAQQQAPTPSAAIAAISVPSLSASASSVPTAPGGARGHRNTIKEAHMSDPTPAPTPQNGAGIPPDAPALPDMIPIGDAATQALFTEQAAQMRAQFAAQMRSQHEALMTQAREQAALEFERWKAEMQAQQAIQTYAEHVTTPTLQRPHALSIKAPDLVALLAETPPTVRPKWQALLDQTLEVGFVDFGEYGSAGPGKDEQTAAQQFNDLVRAKVDKGMGQLAAIQAVAKEHKDLYAEYSKEGR